MGSGGSLTPWSPSNEAGVGSKRVSIDARANKLALLSDQSSVIRGQSEGICPVRLVVDRSEEHTSELQSLMRISYAVLCLTKKKSNYLNMHLTRSTQHTTLRYLHQRSAR